MPEYCYGIDVAPGRMQLVACDTDGGVRFRQHAPAPAAGSPQLVDAVAQLVQDADARLGMHAPLGLSIPGLPRPALAAAMQARLQRPVAMGSDSQCFALGEANGGAADGQHSVVGLLLDDGAGAALVVNGDLVRGRNGVASEWGHWPMPPALLRKHGLPLLSCGCGGSACIECYVSAMGLRNLQMHLTGSAGCGAARLAARCADGDAGARRVLRLHLDLLGAALARLVMAYDPHLVVLGGALAQLPRLHQQLAAATAPHLLRGLGVPPIVAPEFGSAGNARGAALLVAQAAHAASHPA